MFLMCLYIGVMCAEGSWDLEGGGGAKADSTGGGRSSRGGGSRGGGWSQVDAAAPSHGGHLDFLALRDTLIGRLTLASPSALLITYSFLHTHPSFLPVLVSSESVQPLLVALLKTLYTAVNTVSTACKEVATRAGAVRMNSRPSTVPSVESVYLVVIDVLLIVQDVRLRPLLSKMTTRGEDLSWYKEKALGEVQQTALYSVIASVSLTVSLTD